MNLEGIPCQVTGIDEVYKISNTHPDFSQPTFGVSQTKCGQTIDVIEDMQKGILLK